MIYITLVIAASIDRSIVYAAVAAAGAADKPAGAADTGTDGVVAVISPWLVVRSLTWTSKTRRVTRRCQVERRSRPAASEETVTV